MSGDKTITTCHSPSCLSLKGCQRFCDCGYAERVKAQDMKPVTTNTEKAAYIHDKGWTLAEHRQDGNHQYTINGGRNVSLQTAWEIQIAVEKGDQHGFGTN